jgi:hypothetical protein
VERSGLLPDLDLELLVRFSTHDDQTGAARAKPRGARGPEGAASRGVLARAHRSAPLADAG